MSDRPLNILQFTTNFKQGGIQRHILDLTKYLRDIGHNVTLAGAPNVWGNPKIDSDFEPVALDQVSAVDRNVVSRVRAAYRCSKDLRRIVKSRKVDLIHSHETAPAIVAKLAVLGTKLPSVITYHGSAPSRTRQFAQVSRFCADNVVSPSQSTLNQLIEFGVPPERTKVLGLGIEQKPDPDPNTVSSIRSSLNLSSTDILCFSLSRLDHQKGIDIMIEVAKKVLAEQPNIVFAIGGTGPLADEVGAWADEARVSDRFKFLGPVSDVQNYLAASDIFLLTSRWEALPISIVEAFRAGLPVIATDCGGVAELVNNEVGRLCPVGDVECLRQAVSELAGDSGLRDRLGKACLEKSTSKRFDPLAVHQAFESFYKELVWGGQV